MNLRGRSRDVAVILFVVFFIYQVIGFSSGPGKISVLLHHSNLPCEKAVFAVYKVKPHLKRVKKLERVSW